MSEITILQVLLYSGILIYLGYTMGRRDHKTIIKETIEAAKKEVPKSVEKATNDIDQKKSKESLIENIHMVNARNKLKVYKGPKIECNKKGKYAQNKYLSIEYTKKMIESENDHFQQLFESSKKKDDLADSYLQGIYWIEK